LRRRAVGDHQLGRLGRQQRAQGAARCATRAQQKNPPAAKRLPAVPFQIAQQALTIGVVPTPALT
jgi:hypothetical protein